MLRLVLCIDGLDLLLDEVHVVLEFLHLAVHLVDEAAALLRTGIEEAQVVFVGLDFLLECLVLTEQTGALCVKGILATFSHLLEVVLEFVEAAFGDSNIEVFIEFVKDK